MSADQTAPLLNSGPPVLVIPPQDHEQDEKDAPGKPDSLPQLVLGFIFGIVFGLPARFRLPLCKPLLSCRH